MSKSMNVGRLSISMVADTVEYVNKLKDAEAKTQKSLGRITKDFDKAGRASDKNSKKINHVSDRLRNMADTAALVTGPLGGVASRLTIMARIFSGGALAASVFGVATALSGLGLALIKGSRVIDKTILQLQTLDKQMMISGDTVGYTSEQLDVFARKLALSTLTSTEDVRSAMSLLATTSDLTGDSFLRTTELAQDIAQVGFGSITSNAKMLSKALEDPIEGVEKLERFNVSLTEAQKEQVEELVNANQKYAAQAVLLDAVSKKYAGIANTIAAGTIAEQTDEFSQRWDELFEAIARTVGTQPAIVSFLSTLNGMMAQITRGIDPEGAFQMDLDTKLAERIRKEFGGVDRIVANINKGSMKELNDAIAQTSSRLDNSKDRLSLLNSVFQKGSDSFKSSWREILGITDEFASGEDLSRFRQELAQERKTLDEKIKINDRYFSQLNKLKTSAYNQLIKIDEKQSEAEKRLFKEKEKEKQKAALELMDMKTLDTSWGDALSEPFEELAFKLDALDLSELTALDIAMMTPQAIDELEAMVTEAEAVMDVFNEEQNKKHQESVLEKIQNQRILEMEAAAGMMDAKNKLLANKYQEDLDNYREYISGKSNENEKLRQYEQQAAQQFGEKMFQQQMEAKEKETEWLTASLTEVQGAMESIGKDGSDAAKAMFLLNKGMAIANAVMAANQSQAAARANILTKGGDQASAEAAATAAFLSGMMNVAAIAATTVAGVAHGGMDSVPSESTFLLQKGERVVQPKANKDLTEFLNRTDSSGGTTINAPLNIQGNVTDKKWFQQELYKHRQMIASMNRKAKREKPTRGG